MPFPVEVDYARWGRPRRYTREAFLALDRLRSGLILIDYGAVELALLVLDRGARATFFGFHAAMNPTWRRPVPYFQGRRIAPRKLNMVLISDPSLWLHPDVKAGWFLGNRHCELLAELPPILDHVEALLGSERRLLWGNSAGGTAALRYARNDDISVVMNPQIILERFTWGRIKPWAEYGWGCADNEAARALVRRIGDLRLTPPQGRVVYCQNLHDAHVEDHLKPLAGVMGVSAEPGDDGRFKLILGDWGKGHIPPSSDEQAAIVAGEAARLPLARAQRRWWRGW